jgi:hypothetical protein
VGVAVPNWSHRWAAGVPLLRHMCPRALHISARRCESFRVLCLFLENRTSGILSELSEHPCVNFGGQPYLKDLWSKQPQSSSSRCKHEEAVCKGFQLDAAAPFRSTTALQMAPGSRRRWRTPSSRNSRQDLSQETLEARPTDECSILRAPAWQHQLARKTRCHKGPTKGRSSDQG